MGRLPVPLGAAVCLASLDYCAGLVRCARVLVLWYGHSGPAYCQSLSLWVGLGIRCGILGTLWGHLGTSWARFGDILCFFLLGHFMIFHLFVLFFFLVLVKKNPIVSVSPKAIAWGYPLVIAPYNESVGFTSFDSCFFPSLPENCRDLIHFLCNSIFLVSIYTIQTALFVVQLGSVVHWRTTEGLTPVTALRQWAQVWRMPLPAG